MLPVKWGINTSLPRGLSTNGKGTGESVEYLTIKLGPQNRRGQRDWCLCLAYGNASAEEGKREGCAAPGAKAPIDRLFCLGNAIACPPRHAANMFFFAIILLVFFFFVSSNPQYTITALK